MREIGLRSADRHLVVSYCFRGSCASDSQRPGQGVRTRCADRARCGRRYADFRDKDFDQCPHSIPNALAAVDAPGFARTSVFPSISAQWPKKMGAAVVLAIAKRSGALVWVIRETRSCEICSSPLGVEQMRGGLTMPDSRRDEFTWNWGDLASRNRYSFWRAFG